MIFSILKLILILIISPFCVGLIPASVIDRTKVRISQIYLMGFIFLMAVFQLIVVPVIINAPGKFELVVILYSIFQLVLAICGISLLVILIRKYGNPFKWNQQEERIVTKEAIILWVIAMLLVIFQMVMFVFTQYFDGDDAYYVVQSLLTTETNTMYSIKPYTGLTTGIDLRHAMASMPMWIAYIARISGIHSTIVAHSVLGLFLIAIIYMIYFQCAVILFGKDRKRIPIMLIFICIMYIFGNVSIYTSSTFMMTRTWQGKSVLANMVIMTIIWCLLAIFETDEYGKEIRFGYWITLVGINIVAAMCSTASVFLAPILIGISGLIMAIAKKDIQVILRLLVTCLPLVIYAAMYVLL